MRTSLLALAPAGRRRKERAARCPHPETRKNGGRATPTGAGRRTRHANRVTAGQRKAIAQYRASHGPPPT